MLARSGMTKMRQQQEYCPIHNPTSLNYHNGGLIMCSLVEGGRDESPVSVISHSAATAMAISHPSSASASMEHHLNHIINPTYKHHHLINSHPCQEQFIGAGSSTSEDDNSVYNLPNLFFETGGALEELPEAQNPYIPSKAISRKTTNFVKLFEKKSLTSETDLADSSSDDEEHFSIDFQGLQDKSMVLRENFLKVSERMLDYNEEKKAHDKLSAKLKQFGEWKKDQKLINTPMMEEEEPAMATKHVSKGLLKTANLSDNAWVRGSNYVVQKEEKGPQLNEGSNISMEKAYQKASIRREIITSTKLAIVPSKWDDAGKWLCHNNASNEKANYYAIPRQLPQSINTSPIGENLSFDNNLCKDINSAAPASQLLQNINVTPGRGSHSVHVLCRGINHDCASQSPVSDGLILDRKKIKDLHGGLILEKRSIKGNVNDLLQWQRPTIDYNNSLNSGEIVEANSLPNNYSQSNSNPNIAAISASNSEINANYGSDHPHRSSANYTQRFKQHQILQKLRKKYASNGGLKRGEMVGEGAAQNLGNKTIIGRNNAVSRISNITVLQASPQKAKAFTQDKLYANTELEGKLDEDIVRQNIEFFVQTPKHGRSASMKDACTEVSPSISRRDMGTQMTPLTSSRTSNSASPIKNNSPARHNTPARRSTSSNHELNNSISSANDVINCGKDHLNLLELESCHLAKLELRDQLPSGSQVFHESFDKTSAVFCNNWSPTKLEGENVAGINEAVEMNASIMRFNVLEARAAAWEEAERAKFNAKFKREEAKIDAWVTLQRSKAEAELKKLEVKLEKLRSQATEKVMNKVMAAGKRAEEMRAAAEAQQAEQMRRVTERVSNLRKNAHFPGSFAVCFARNMP